MPVWHVAGNMVTAHAYHTATLVPDGRVLVAGGVINDRLDGSVLASAELFDPASGAWTATGAMIDARWSHSATLLPDGRVLLAGGRGNSDSNYGLLSTAELYDPETGRWTATERMAEARDGHTATLLPDGMVIVAGDYNDQSRASAERYDPGSGS